MLVESRNVSGAGNNCFLHALAGILGKHKLCLMLSCGDPQTVKAEDIRWGIVRLVQLPNDKDVNNLVFNLTVLAQSLESNGNSETMISNMLNMPEEIVKCFLQGNPTVVKQCFAETFMTSSCQVSQFEVDLINTVLEKNSLQLIVLSVPPGKPADRNVVLGALRETIFHRAEAGKLLPTATYIVMTNTGIHYRYLAIDRKTHFSSSKLLEFIQTDDRNIDYTNNGDVGEVNLAGGKKKRLVKKPKNLK
jgi:hypothetical protein